MPERVTVNITGMDPVEMDAALVAPRLREAVEAMNRSSGRSLKPQSMLLQVAGVDALLALVEAVRVLTFTIDRAFPPSRDT